MMPTDAQMEMQIEMVGEQFNLPDSEIEYDQKRWQQGRAEHAGGKDEIHNFSLYELLINIRQELSDGWIYCARAPLMERLLPYEQAALWRIHHNLAAARSDALWLIRVRTAAAQTGGGRGGAASAQTADSANAYNQWEAYSAAYRKARLLQMAVGDGGKENNQGGENNA